METIKTKITLSDGTKQKFKGNAVLGVSAREDEFECFTKGEISELEAIEALCNLILEVDDCMECEGNLATSIALAIMVNDHFQDAD